MSESSKKHTRTGTIPGELLPELAGLIDSIGDGIAVVVEGGRYVYVSEGAARMTGYSVEELFELGLDRLIHPDERANIRKMLAGNLSGSDTPTRHETAILRKDGSKSWAEVTDRRILWKGEPAIMVLLKDLTPHMRAKAETARQETQYRDLLEMMGVGVLSYDENGVCTYVNKGVTELLQCRREDMIGLQTLKLFEESYQGKVQERIDQRRKGVAESYDYEIRRKDGTTIPIRVSSSPIIDENGSFQGSVAVATDMTSRKEAERAEKEHTRKIEIMNRIMVRGNRAQDVTLFLEDIVEATMELMQFDGGAAFLVDRDAGVARLVFNKGVIPDKIQELSEIPLGSEPYGAVFTDGKPIQRKLPTKNGDNKTGFLFGISVPIVSGKTIVGALSIGNTMSHTFTPEEIDTLTAIGEEAGAAIFRIRSEAALRESEMGFRALAENANDGIMISSEKGVIIYSNRRSCEILGYEHGEVVGMPFAEVVYKDDVEKAVDSFKRRVHDREVQQGFEIRARHKSDRPVPVEVSVSEIIWQGSVASISIIRDVTERKKQEKLDHQYAEELEAEVARRTETLRVVERRHAVAERQASVGRMAARIAHEINNPLAGVKNSLRLIRDALPINHQYYDYIGMIDGEIDRMSSIVRQMYVIHKPEASTVREIQVPSVVKEVVDLLRVSFEKHRVVARTGFGDPRFVATLAEGSFRQILFNLIQNAIEASPPGGVVDIGTKEEDGRLILEIRDRGPGIPEKIRDKIYEPFFTTKDDLVDGGLGLGLPNTLSLVKGSLQGEITFSDEAGGGTLFRVSIPLEADKNTGGRE